MAAKINPALMARIMKAGLSRAAAYRWVARKVDELVVPSDVAALAVAQELKIPINRYATGEQLESLRVAKGGGARASHAPVALPPMTTKSQNGSKGRKARPMSKDAANTVFVVHGRDSKVRDSMFQLLRALGLNPVEWNTAVGYTRDAAPHISRVLDAAFKRASVAVILFTPDDEARLQPHFHRDDDEAVDTEFRGQARPNVLFEAGIALALRPKKTVLVEVGKLRPFTDISGMHTVRLTGTPASRQGFVTKLKNAGCSPNTTGTDWLTVGDFTPTAAIATNTKSNKPGKRR